MEKTFPAEIESAVHDAAIRLGKALDFLEWPNGERDAPPHEINALINLQGRLANLEPPYHFYSEGSISQRGRVDLLASNGAISLAIEAKRFGDINERSDSIAKDLERIRGFEPAYYVGDGSRALNRWWEKSEQRWALLIITSFRGDEVKEAWIAPGDAQAKKLMESYRSKSDRPKDDGSGFMALRAVQGLYRFAAPITLSERWSDTGRGYFLCGALAL